MSGIPGVTLRGVEALPVEVEVEITGGIFQVNIVGMPNVAVRESKERVRAALRALGLTLKGRISVNLAPADIPKEGALLDLQIALGMMQASGHLKDCPRALYMGELSLDGRLRRVRGAVPAAFLAKEMNIPLTFRERTQKRLLLFPESRHIARTTWANSLCASAEKNRPSPYLRRMYLT